MAVAIFVLVLLLIAVAVTIPLVLLLGGKLRLTRHSIVIIVMFSCMLMFKIWIARNYDIKTCFIERQERQAGFILRRSVFAQPCLYAGSVCPIQCRIQNNRMTRVCNHACTGHVRLNCSQSPISVTRTMRSMWKRQTHQTQVSCNRHTYISSGGSWGAKKVLLLDATCGKSWILQLYHRRYIDIGSCTYNNRQSTFWMRILSMIKYFS